MTGPVGLVELRWLGTKLTFSGRANAGVEDAKELAIAFVVSVTEVSDEQQNWIAKKGKDSIFATLREIFPEVRLA